MSATYEVTVDLTGDGCTQPGQVWTWVLRSQVPFQHPVELASGLLTTTCASDDGYELAIQEARRWIKRQFKPLPVTSILTPEESFT